MTPEQGKSGPQMFERPSAAHMRNLWEDPASLIAAHKKILEERGESIVEKLEECPLPIRLRSLVLLQPDQLQSIGINITSGTPRLEVTREAMFRMHVFGDKTTGEEHVAVIKGIGNGENVPIRIHSSCITAETFHASNCDCHEQLEMALAIAEREKCGGVIWLHQEGRGNGLTAKAKQLTLMVEQGMNTVEAFETAGYPSETRDFTPAAEILKALGVKSVRLITNNPDKIKQIESLGIPVTGRIACEVPPINEVVRKDLIAKRDRHGHMLVEHL